jgi:SAM-dependent methyltransferase
LSTPSLAPLLKAATLPYRKAGLFAYFFARSKLRQDPVYRAILERGLLTGRSRILDLGCGQALLTAWLRAATRVSGQGRWPEHWPAVPQPSSIRGIELMPRDVVRARKALGSDIDLDTGDIRHVEFGKADAIVVLDVLHYLDAEAQRSVLLRARQALPPTGLMLLRICDADAGLRFCYTQWVDRIVMLSRGHLAVTPLSRTVREWQTLLQECGFASEAQPMSQGTPFANVLLIARAAPHPESAVTAPVGRSPGS